MKFKLLLSIVFLFIFSSFARAAIEFDGVDDYISINQGIGSLSDFTVSTWVYLKAINPGAGNRSYIIDFRGSGSLIPDSIGLFVDGSTEINIFTHYSAPSFSQYVHTSPSILNNWVHIAAARAGTNFKMFLNGQEVALVYDDGIAPLATAMSLSNKKRIGTYSNATTGSYFFNGLIDDTRVYNRLLRNGEVLALYNSRSKRPSGSLANGLVAHYEMDDQEIGHLAAQAQDDSGNLNHGELVGFDNLVSNGFSHDIPNQIETGTSLEFDGVDDFVEANLNLSTTDVITTSFWYKKPNSSGVKAILELSSNFNSSNVGFVFSVDETGGPCTGYGVAIGLRGDTGYNLACRNTAVPLNQWHHYLGIFDKGASAANETQLYIDGVLQTVFRPGGFSTEKSNNFANDSLFFMSRGGSSLFNSGFLDDVRIYNKRLSNGEISFLHNGTGLNPGTSNLEALWAFDDSALKDSSGNDNHGVGIGGDSLKYTEGVLRR